MSIFGNILKRGSVVSGGRADVFDDFWYSVVGGPSKSGQFVNRTSAMQQKTVYSCVSLIAETLAQLPLKLKRKLPDGSTEDATDHPLFDILKNSPNPEMTSFTWRETGQTHLLLSGNKYSWIERSRLGIKGLWPIDSQKIIPKRVKNPSTTIDDFDQGRRNKIYYEVQTTRGTVPIPARDMLHVPGLGFNGLVGISVIQDFARDTIGLGMSLEEFQSHYFKNGIAVSGVLEHPGTLGENKENFIKALKSRYGGSGNTGVPMVLENGMEWKPLKASLADQQFIDLLKLSAVDICGIFKVPPFKIGIHGKNTSFNNTEQQNKSFLDTTMLQWIVRDEQAANMKLLTVRERSDGLFVKHNFDSLLRPDSKTRAEINQIEWQMGVPTNDLLMRDDRAPVEGGDIGRVPMNFVRVDQETIEPVVPAARSCGHGDTAPTLIELREKQTRSIAGRDRIARAWGPVIRKTAQRIVNRESTAVKRATKKARNNRADADFEKWLDTFYRDMAVIIDNEMRPVLDGFMTQMRDMVAGEVGAGEITEEFETFMAEYTDGYVRQYVDSSKGQLVEMVREKDLDAVDERVDEWTEKRADKEEFKETNTVPNAVVYSVVGAMGLRMVWALRGPTSCPYCKSMEGKKVRAGGSFLDAGTNLDPDGGTGPMLIKGTTRFPQLHSKCDCFLLPG